MHEKYSRRKAVKNMVAVTAGLATANLSALAGQSTTASRKLKGNVYHSVCRWTYNMLTLEELCTAAQKIGIKAIDLAGPKDWPTLQRYGLYSSMCNGAEINLSDGFNDKRFHSQLTERYTAHINLVANAGYKNLICFSGNRRGMDDETGLKNCAEGLKKIISHAEKNNVVLVMELLNSKVDHADYMCDRSKWGVELCKAVGSENFKLLYDIYHMQIDEGDVIHTIKDSHQYFAHYHTGGVPGRHEIDESQELFYPAIVRAILSTGFKGYIAQEFIPTGKTKSENIASLANAIKICDV